MINIIIILLLCIIIYLCYKNYNKILNNINIKYFNSHDAYVYIINNSKEYIQNMNEYNLIARNCLSIDDLLNKYKEDAFDNISSTEIIIINKKIYDTLNKIKKNNINYYNYLKYWLNNVYIAKSKKWLESNMPHTCGKLIIMNNEWFKNQNINILIHEITHIHQRLFPGDFIKLYNQLGYVNKVIYDTDLIYKYNRNNPDGLDINWIWNNIHKNTLWWCGAIFKSNKPYNLHDINHVAIEITIDKNNDYILSKNIILLNDFTDFIDFFGNYNDNYHPNEMCAIYAEWYFNEIINKETYNYPAYNIYKQYIYKLLYDNY